MDDQKTDREGWWRLTKPQFSLKHIFASMSLVAVGLFLAVYYYREIPSTQGSLVAYFGGGLLVGADAFLPFGRWKIGMAIAFVIQLVITTLVLTSHHP